MNFKRMIAAGVFIGFGVIINTVAPNPILGAALFSLGLLGIIHLKLPLYTGQVGFKPNPAFLIPCLFFNWIGTCIVCLLYSFSNNSFFENLQEAAESKWSQTAAHFFIGGILCGALIHIAAKCKNQIIIILVIMVFILSKMEHCIADIPYVFALDESNQTMAMIKCCIVVIGNSIGALLIEYLIGDTNAITRIKNE